MPAITYIAGYCAHAALKKLSCAECREHLIHNRNLVVKDASLIENMSRGGRKLLQPFVVNAVLYTSVVLDKLTAKENCQKFHASCNQKRILRALVHHILEEHEESNPCLNGHTHELVLRHVLHAAVNTLLNNYTKLRNDHLQRKQQTTCRN